MSHPDETEVTRTAQKRPEVTPPAIREGDKVGRFSILGTVGEGGMGRIYEAYDPNLDRRIALKLLHDAGDDRNRQRLVREAQALARLDHPNVVTVHEVGLHDGRVFVAMEFVSGGTLKSWAANHPVGSKERTMEALRMLVDAGRGLVAAHEAGLVHRDVKPSNILIGEDGRARVADFGIARALERDDSLDVSETCDSEGNVLLSTDDSRGSLTRTGASIGTPAYMAPEQFGRGEVDAAADQFSFCVTGWETLFGVRPFEGADLRSRLAAIRSAQLRRPDEAELDAEVEALLRRGLRFRASARHRSLSALVGELAAAANDQPTRRRPVRWALGLGLLATGGAFSAYFVGKGEALCSGGPEALAAVWNGERRTEVREAVLASGLSYAESTWRRVETGLDAYGDAWIAAYGDACEATQVRGEQTPERMAERITCLDDGKRHIVAMLDLLQQGDADALAGADEMLEALPSIRACEQATGLSGGDEAVLASLAEAKALRLAGRPAEAMEAVAVLVASADDVSPPARARLMLEHGKGLAESGDVLSSIDPLRRAYALAHAEGLAGVAAEAAIELATRKHELRDSIETVRMWWELAKAEAANSAEPMACELLWVEAMVLKSDGDWEVAEAVHRKAAELSRDDPVRHARAVRHLALHLGQFELDEKGGVEEAQRALDLHRRHFGDQHPGAAVYELALAENLKRTGESDKALEAVIRAVERRELAYGKESRALGEYLSVAGEIACGAGRGEEGIAWAEKAVEIYRDDMSPARFDALARLQVCAAADPKQAIPVIQERLELARRVFGEDHYLTLATRADYAMLLLGPETYELAEEQLIIASTMASNANSDRPDLVAATNGKLAAVASVLGEFELAMDHAEVAMEAARALPSISIDTKTNVSAQVCTAKRTIATRASEDSEAALDACLEALELAEQGSDERFAAGLRLDVGVMLGSLERYREALEYLDVALLDWRRIAGDESHLVSIALNLSAFALERMERRQLAESRYREAYEIRKKTGGPNSPLEPGAGYARMLAARGAIAEAMEVLGELEGLISDGDLSGRAALSETRGYVHGRQNRKKARDRAYSEAYRLYVRAGYPAFAATICDQIDFELEECQQAADATLD